MAKGHFGRATDQQLRSYGDQLVDAAERAASQTTGWLCLTVRLGQHVVALRSLDPAIHQLLNRAMWHVSTDQPATVTISICDSASAETEPPTEPDWTRDHWRHEGPSAVLYFDRDRHMVTWTDASTGTGVWWLPNEASIPAWERPAPLRTLIDRLLGPLGATLVHGGIVGADRQGVLLAGRGGSGKSTSVIACVADGMHCGGDDFLLIDNTLPTTVFSMYATARLTPTSPGWSRFAAVADAIEQPVNAFDDDPNLAKKTLYLGEQFADSVRTEWTVRAVVIPSVVNSRDTTATRIRPAVALRALAPSSMLQLDPRRSALSTMAAMVAMVPCFSLYVGSDLDQVPTTVAAILADQTGSAS